METNKKNALTLIKQLMQEYGIMIYEVAQMFDADFDLLCIKDGKKVRLPFDSGKNCNPLGIFPFKDMNIYFELSETSETSRIFADARRLPAEAFCDRVCEIKDELNEYLKILQKPLINGCYFAVGENLSGLNWIVGFDDETDWHQVIMIRMKKLRFAMLALFSFDNNKKQLLRNAAVFY